MSTDTFNKITGKISKKYNVINHKTINYVDDSTNMVTFRCKNDISKYLSDYYTLLDSFYNINKLLINADKTKFIIISNKKQRNNLSDVHFYANQFRIDQSNIIKILGTFIHFNLNYDHQVNSIVSKMSNRLYQLRKLKPVTNFKTRITIINAMKIGILNYTLPMYSNCNKAQIMKLHKVLINSARTAIGNYCFRISNVKILNKCNCLGHFPKKIFMMFWSVRPFWYMV